jgi:hypothetical protein
MDKSVSESEATGNNVFVCFLLVDLEILCSGFLTTRNSIVGIFTNLERLFGPSLDVN